MVYKTVRFEGSDDVTSRPAEPTALTRPIQWITAVFSVLATMGTALVLGYVTPEILLAHTEIAPKDVAGFLFTYRVTGVVFMFANAVGILALWGKAWIFYFVLVLNVSQGIGALTVDVEWTGLAEGPLALVGHYVTDGGGGVLAIALLASLLVYRRAWAYRAVRTDATHPSQSPGSQHRPM